MAPIQIILLAFLAFAILRAFWRFHQSHIAWNALIFWLLLWGAITIVVIKPDITSRLAALAGVGRGADLVLYGAAVLLFYLVFYFMVKIDAIDQDITKIISALALKDIKQDNNEQKMESKN